MNVELDEKLFARLETLADTQRKSVNDLVEVAVIDYLTRQAKETDFRVQVRDVMVKHQRLLDELSKR